MYTTTRRIAGETFMACSECGHAAGMNDLCKTPLQSAADMLSHMAAHKASRAIVPVAPTTPKLEAIRDLGGKGVSA